MNLEQKYWVAGLLEGEGCFTLNKRKVNGKYYVSLRVECNMTDEDIIRQLAEWSGVGIVFGPYKKAGKNREHHKVYWHWAVNKQDEAESFMREIYPFLGIRRKQQIDHAFEVLGLTR